MKSLAALAMGLGALSLALGCVPLGEDSDTELVLRAGSGDLVQAVKGVQRFSFHPRARLVRPQQGRTDKELREATDTSLQAVLHEKGYGLANPGESKRTFAYAIGVSGALSDAELVKIFGISAGVDSFGEASGRAGLVLALLDTESGQVLWRGSASAPWDVTTLRPASEVGVEIRKAFEKMLEDLPHRW